MVRGGILRVAVVGGGPRGASAVERLFAVYAQQTRSAALSPRAHQVVRLDVTVYDPFRPGPGRVWRTDQPRLFLMNTPSFYPTLIPSEPGLAAPLAGSTFDEWRACQREAIEAGTCALGPEEQAELKGLESNDFPPRALYGRYLEETWAALVAAAPQGVSVRHVAAEVARVGRTPHGFAVTCVNARAQEADAVVLALGHVPARLGGDQQALADAAARLGLHYFPPAAPADVEWDALPAGQTILVRGMGLNFFDVMAALTEGRGGRFSEGAGGRLAYTPSGREPHIVAASRRGVPYRGKAELGAYYAPSVQLRWFTREAALAPRRAGIQPSFDQDLWPLLHRDTLWAYYTTLARVDPGTVSEGFLARLDDALEVEGPGWETRASQVVHDGVVPARRLDLRALGVPLAGWHAHDRADLDARVLEHLDADAAGSAAGEDNPLKMAIAALHRGRAVLKEAVADGGITEASWVSGLRGWFEGLIEGLASGPPAQRIRQLAALVRAGVVSTVGPEPRFSIDRLGLGGPAFTAASPWVGGPEVRARWFVEALAPANIVGRAESQLLEGLLADGLVRPRFLAGADGVPQAASGLDVTLPPYRALDVNGQPVEGLYVLGLQLSAVQWGTAIAAEAHPFAAPGEAREGAPYPSAQRTLRDADAIAQHILAMPSGR
ncbi:FAD/NAD(P)-binding protein [Sinomonas notoginsengisoli]|uniref:FAD/NAD(P)-binding protein n=1 Tax=Sinomonas notoginsengisoli TaxID=1457311 RepID=UPI001F429FA0|nr:FAD/NAD(P)-binding protein [Sinomonas notoginsengisoli]